MNVVEVKNVKLGEGIPKICVPLVGVTKEDILSEARLCLDIPVDLVEWRVDWYEHAGQFEQAADVLKEMRTILPDTPILFTFRTANEGGEKAIAPEDYKQLNVAAAKSGLVDLVDVEVFTGDEIVSEIITAAHECGVKVVASNHDFNKTPPQTEIVARLLKMQKLGADIPKIAVMPNSKKDVLTLLAATQEMASDYADRPIITMSMKDTGVISRLCGEVFGSALTFGSAKKASAPGQIGAEDLKEILTLLHKAVN